MATMMGTHGLTMSTNADGTESMNPSQGNELTSQLTGLKRRHGGNISYARQIIMEVAQLIENTSGESDVEVTLHANKEILVGKERMLKDYHEQILSRLENDEDITSKIEYHNFSKELRKSLYLLNKCLSHKEEKRRSDPQHLKTDNSTRLPKLHLNMFDGNPLAFQPFWDTFNSTVHSNCALDDVSKFNYLKSLLEGKANACLLGLDTTSENYKNAIELLHE